MNKSFKSFLNKQKKKRKPLLVPVKRPKRAKKGGYPFGTRKGDGGLAGGFGLAFGGGFFGAEGGLGESVLRETKFFYEDEEEHKKPLTPNRVQPKNHDRFMKDDKENQLDDEDSEKEENDIEVEDLSGGDSEDTDDSEESIDLSSDSDEESEENEDPNKQGLLRKVPGAHLVYKRQIETGQYEEMWSYKVEKNIKDETKLKNAILAGTDIDPRRGISEDGQQSYEIWTAGNAQILVITGLPN